jgi:hypothetical protein
MDGQLAINTLKSFHDIMSPEDFSEFIKGEDSEKLRAFPEVVEFMKGEKPWDKKEEKEEPREKKEEKEDDDEKGEEKKKEDDDDEKAVTPELIKGLEDKMNTKFDAVTNILKSFDNSDEISELKKSVDDVFNLLSKVAGMPQGTKAVRTGSANFFEKSFGGAQEQDDDGKKILSVGRDKGVILKALESGMEKAVDPVLANAYGDSIINYNGGDGMIAKAVAMDLFENHGIRLTQ